MFGVKGTQQVDVALIDDSLMGNVASKDHHLSRFDRDLGVTVQKVGILVGVFEEYEGKNVVGATVESASGEGVLGLLS